MPNIDNPWPDRQAQADHEQSVFERAHEAWITAHMDRALEIMSQVHELEREYESEFDCSMDIQEIFNISRADVREYDARQYAAKHGKKAI